MNTSEQSKAEEAAPTLEIKQGNATYIVGIHFSNKHTQTLEEKLKGLIRNEVLTTPCSLY